MRLRPLGGDSGIIGMASGIAQRSTSRSMHILNLQHKSCFFSAFFLFIFAYLWFRHYRPGIAQRSTINIFKKKFLHQCQMLCIKPALSLSLSSCRNLKIKNLIFIGNLVFNFGSRQGETNCWRWTMFSPSLQEYVMFLLGPCCCVQMILMMIRYENDLKPVRNMQSWLSPHHIEIRTKLHTVLLNVIY